MSEDDVCRCDPPSCVVLMTMPPMCPNCRKTLAGWRRRPPIVTAAPDATVEVGGEIAADVVTLPLPSVYRDEDPPAS